MQIGVPYRNLIYYLEGEMYMNRVIIIKIKIDAVKVDPNIEKTAMNSLKNQIEGYYNSSPKDNDFLKIRYKEFGNQQCLIMFIFYTKEGKIFTSKEKNGESEVVKIVIGKGHLYEQKAYSRTNIKYRMYKEINDKRIIANLLDNIELELDADYEEKSYVMVSTETQLLNDINDLIIDKNIISVNKTYVNKWDIYKLEEYAQHNNQCKRMFSISDESNERNEFQRDRERIVNSRAFRRMVDKAQIFSATKGDHYRTRMTHTLEVNQIAKAIAYSLGLNIDLTEAIALSHDLGHTPFGHQGERTLHDILLGKKNREIFNLSKNFFSNNFFGGFKHNYQGIRVLAKLENKYIEHPGLDVSFQVLEGALKHTRMKDDVVLEEFIDKRYIDEIKPGFEHATSLEGQVVEIADEIAQRGHDIDDSLSSGLISLEELLNLLELEKFNDLSKQIFLEKSKIEDNIRIYENISELIVARLISCIVDYFINDVIDQSRINISGFSGDKRKGVFEKRLINMSPKGKAICKFLEKTVNKKVISNSEVALFDSNANAIVEKLFESYYKNPKLLNKGTIRKVYIDTLRHNNSWVSQTAIKLCDGNLDIINDEIYRITQEYIDYSKYISGDVDQFVYAEKRKILVRNIVDYIAGMTDSYAVKEYNKIV